MVEEHTCEVSQCVQHNVCALKAYKDHNIDNTRSLGMEGWTGWARLVNCYDGDTITVIVFFLGESFKVTVRVAGIDAPEINISSTKARALEARDALIKYLTGIESKGLSSRQVKDTLRENVYLVWLVCSKFDKYGRVLCDVYNTNVARSVNVAEMLIGAGIAQRYTGQGLRPLATQDQ